MAIIVWLGVILFAGQSFILLHWEACLVLFTVFVLAPPCLRRLQVWEALPYYVAALAITTGYIFPEFPGRLAAFGLYVAVTLYFFLKAFFRQYRNRHLENALRLFALGYWVVGAVWAFFWAAGIRPFHFDSNIGALTAAHFHVAGFILTVLIRQLWLTRPNNLHIGLAGGALLGMPLVASGIVATQLGFPPILETSAAAFFAILVILTAWAQIKTGKTLGVFPAVYWWWAAAICLAFGIGLALLYAARFWYPISWINIPNMKAWHGTLNSVGFAFFSIIGWERWDKNR